VTLLSRSSGTTAVCGAAIAVAAMVAACSATPPTSALPGTVPATPPPATVAPTIQPSFQVPGSPSALTPAEIRAKIEPFAGQGVISIGEGAGGVIVVGLQASGEALARELHATYGPAVQLSVGLFPFPPPAAPGKPCLQMPATMPLHAPLAGALIVDGPVVAGDFFQGAVRLTNAGPAPFELSTSSGFPARIFRPGEPTPIGASEGGSAGTGFSKRLTPGETVELGAGGGTASCDLALGYALPAGTYQARALIDYSDPATLELRYFWSEAATIEIVDP
jgi:hypothetical protein